MRNRQTLPDALDALEQFENKKAGRALHVFLDFDGTLAPITERPEDATLDRAMRARIERLALEHRTAVISGRGLDDLVERVEIPNIFYAGSHGLELRHPDGRVEANDAAEQAAAGLDDLERQLFERLGDLDGVQFERKRFGLAVHYRRAAASAAQAVKDAVRETAASDDKWALKNGKKVFEFVPDLDWDKGHAVLWILETTGVDRDNALPLYIGDDVTDEDAFRAIDGWGIGIAVGDDGPAETAAHWRLESVAEVGRLLDRLATDDD